VVTLAALLPFTDENLPLSQTCTRIHVHLIYSMYMELQLLRATVGYSRDRTLGIVRGDAGGQ
jgi:hypothetical protein